jgi:putative MATE family efflux protein
LTRSPNPARVELHVVALGAKTQRADPRVDPRLRAQQAILEGPVLATILKFAWPTVLVIVAQVMVGIAETFYVSYLGTAALAGVALVLPLLMLMTMMSNGGIGGGVSSAVARAIGAKRRDDADALVLHALIIAILFGVGFTVATLLFGRTIYVWLGGTGEVLDAALTYSGFVFIGAVPSWIVSQMAATLRGSGNVRLPAIVTLVSAAVLIALSPALIFGIGPLPGLGIAGAGTAVSAFNVVAAVVLVRYVASGRGLVVLRRGRLEIRLFREILRVGLLSALGTVQFNLVVVFITGAVGLFGTDALAGYGIAARLDYVLVPLLFGLGTSIVTMVGTNIGAGAFAREAHCLDRCIAGGVRHRGDRLLCRHMAARVARSVHERSGRAGDRGPLSTDCRAVLWGDRARDAALFRGPGRRSCGLADHRRHGAPCPCSAFQLGSRPPLWPRVTGAVCNRRSGHCHIWCDQCFRDAPRRLGPPTT